LRQIGRRLATGIDQAASSGEYPGGSGENAEQRKQHHDTRGGKFGEANSEGIERRIATGKIFIGQRKKFLCRHADINFSAPKIPRCMDAEIARFSIKKIRHANVKD